LERLTRSADFKRVRDKGKSYSHPLVVLIVLPKDADSSSRFGISAGWSVGNAVKRNRAKRLLRSALLTLQHSSLLIPILNGWDIVFLARRPILSMKCQKVQEAILILFAKAHLLDVEHGNN
jgi:ribonuclease P protein component